MKLSEFIPRNRNKLLYFDNWFSSLPLMTQLHNDRIGYIGIMRAKRISGIVQKKMTKKLNKDEGGATKNIVVK